MWYLGHRLESGKPQPAVGRHDAGDERVLDHEEGSGADGGTLGRCAEGDIFSPP